MVIAKDHYQSIGIVCLSVISGVQRVTCKQSISCNYCCYYSHCLHSVHRCELLLQIYVHSVVCLSVCLSVCCSRPRALQKQLADRVPFGGGGAGS